MRTISLVLQLACAFASAPTTPIAGYFWWIAKIERSLPDRSVAGSRSSVVYGPHGALGMAWSFKNDEGTDDISIVPADLLGATKVSVFKSGERIASELEWMPTGQWVVDTSAAAVTLGTEIVLRPGEWIEWRASLRRTDKLAWDQGNYEIRIDMTPALSTVRRSGQKPWGGRVERQATLLLRIAEGESLMARKMTLRIDGAQAFTEGRYRDAVVHYRNLVGLDATDRSSYGGLGRALVATGDFKGAVGALEMALPIALQGDRGPIPDALAYAYVALGDEANASRVLRMIMPERDVPAKLNSLRANVRKQ